MSDVEEDDFINDLDEDFGPSYSDSENEELNEVQDEIIEPLKIQEDISVVTENLNITDILKKFIEDYTRYNIGGEHVEEVEPSGISKLVELGPQIETLLNDKTVNLEEILTLLSELSPLIQNDISVLQRYIALIYSQKFGELESLIPSATEFANVIKLFESLTPAECNDQYLSQQLQSMDKLSKEQILVVSMSMKTSFNKTIEFTYKIKQNLLEATNSIIYLAQLRDDISNYVSSKIDNIAPNVCALLGPEITSLLISHSGGILGLSRIPNCNLAAIGKNKHISHEQHTVGSGLRQNGYISKAEIIQNEPITNHKQMLRMVCAKVSLAARVDAGQKGNEKDNSLGLKWKEEILSRIKKLHDVPNVSNIKALPIPEDKSKKKRAGRKFRKYKEQFQLSHMRQLQNRMEFGKQETTVMDAYGEEIGLGMTNTPLQQMSNSNVSNRRTNNNSKMSKKMKKRINEADEQTKEYMLSLDANELTSTSEDNTNKHANKKQKTETNNNSWFSHHLK